MIDQIHSVSDNDRRKYFATWISHSSSKAFLDCQLAWYYQYVWRNPATNHKIRLTAPPLSLGKAVHAVLDELNTIPVAQRFDTPILERYERIWQDFSGRKGGFSSELDERGYKDRGAAMLVTVERNPGPLAYKTVRLKQKLPSVWFSESESIIACGLVDWLKYLQEHDSLEIYDFKTGKSKESEHSLQLVFYTLLAQFCQTGNRAIAGAYYWYLEQNNSPQKKELPDLEQGYTDILAIALQMQEARKTKKKIQCSHGSGCRACDPYKKIADGKAEYIGVDVLGYDQFTLK